MDCQPTSNLNSRALALGAIVTTTVVCLPGSRFSAAVPEALPTSLPSVSTARTVTLMPLAGDSPLVHKRGGHLPLPVLQDLLVVGLQHHPGRPSHLVLVLLGVLRPSAFTTSLKKWFTSLSVTTRAPVPSAALAAANGLLGPLSFSASGADADGLAALVAAMSTAVSGYDCTRPSARCTTTRFPCCEKPWTARVLPPFSTRVAAPTQPATRTNTRTMASFLTHTSDMLQSS